MPIYEYRCEACDHELEALQKMSADPLKECPECSKPSLIKKISASGFRLSGSGWYETDFKKSGTKKNLAGDSGKPAADKSKEKKASSTKSDTKPKKASSTSD